MGFGRKPSTSCRRWGISSRPLLLTITALTLAAFLWQCSDNERGDVIGPTSGHKFIASTSPTDNAINVSRNNSISIFFLRPMDIGTMSARKFHINREIMYSVSYDSLKAVMHVANPLDRFAEYCVTVDTGMADKAGNVMKTPYSFSFLTETGHPAIAALSPSNGSTDVPLNAVVTVTFTKEMNPATIDSTSVHLDGNMPYSIAYAARRLVLTPASRSEEATVSVI